ncbi:unnamed protein product [Ostreobium quekettii]|uniref:J domain-containing protein n=1 Tax=Ostreobium quekettii TaxID=121088 RepID=A0A8S1IP96_9CHLO|nr:unnamed protein product [Ostreobium quekettii]|eukprot:evm.model.scf_249.13 EVM.evm.TU.scf_249.13   scf_249:95293-99392(-)
MLAPQLSPVPGVASSTGLTLWGAVLSTIILELGWNLGACADPQRDGVQIMIQNGDRSVSSGEYSDALSSYSAAIELDPKSPMLYSKRAAAYLILRQHGHALRDLDRAMELDREYVQGFIQRGRAHLEVCKFDGAEEDYQAVLELKPGHKTATAELAKISDGRKSEKAMKEWHEKGDFQKARDAMNGLFGIAKDCLSARLLESQMSFAEGEYGQVVSQTGRILKSDSRNLQAFYLRGMAYVQLGDVTVAKQHFGEALRHDPDYKDAKNAFKEVKAFERKVKALNAALDAREWRTAQSACEEALEFLPNDVDLRWKLCQSLHYGGNQTGAIEACEKVLELDTGHDEAEALRIHALIAAEEFERAVEEGEAAYNRNRESSKLREAYHAATKALKKSKRKDYYKVLGVPEDASEPQIKSAYKKLALKYHPDKAVDKAEGEIKFREATEAYEVLMDPEKRARFDAGEDLDDPNSGMGNHPFFRAGGFGGQTFTFHFG